jgi:hypothetical protein
VFVGVCVAGFFGECRCGNNKRGGEDRDDFHWT